MLPIPTPPPSPDVWIPRSLVAVTEEIPSIFVESLPSINAVVPSEYI